MSADENKNNNKIDEDAVNVKYVDSIQLPKEKGSKGPLIATIVLSLLLVAATGYIVYDAIMDAKRDTEVADQEETEQEEDQGLVEEIEDIVDEKTFNLNYIGDQGDGKEYDLGVSYYGVAVTEGENLRDFKTSLNYGNNQYGLSGADNYESKDSNNIGFSSDVRAVVSGGIGQDIGGEVIVFLLEDGSVEYIPVRRCLTAGKVWTEKVSGVKKVVSISGANVSKADGGYTTVILEQSDGSFYDLSDYVNMV